VGRLVESAVGSSAVDGSVRSVGRAAIASVGRVQAVRARQAFRLAWVLLERAIHALNSFSGSTGAFRTSRARVSDVGTNEVVIEAWGCGNAFPHPVRGSVRAGGASGAVVINLVFDIDGGIRIFASSNEDTVTRESAAVGVDVGTSRVLRPSQIVGNQSVVHRIDESASE